MTWLRQSRLGELTAPRTFLWATGVEDTFITAPWPASGRTLDEYELTQHYERYAADIGLMADLGVNAVRYGIPWHRINPAPGVWEWDWADRALNSILDRGIEPIVDLVHYGLPVWIEGAYLHPDYPAFVAEYASRVAARYRGRIHAYTPLNEPRITAWYCGYLGWWPPFRRTWTGFVAVLLAICRGIVETVDALRRVDPEILPLHVDATDRYTTTDPQLMGEVAHRQELIFLALDLISGRITPEHTLWPWLRDRGATETHLLWFQAHAVELPLIGLNLYPMFTLKSLTRDARGAMRWRMPYARAELVEQVGNLYWQRYRVPLWISETASVGSIRRRCAWLDDSVRAVRRLREGGVPMVGYTWWPLFALVTWAYRQGRHPAAYYLRQMGLWDLDAALERRPTPLVGQYRDVIKRGLDDVGVLPLREPGPAADDSRPPRS